MTKAKMQLLLTLVLVLAAVAPTFAQFGLGADVVSRYVWRGTDFGNQLSVQPYASYTAGNVEVGAWGSFGAVNGGANENDLYITFSQSGFSLTLTDYFFPALSNGVATDNNFGKYGSDDGAHFLEIMGGYSQNGVGFTAGYFFSGIGLKKSIYLQGSYELQIEGDVAANLFLGAGNEAYTDDTKFDVIEIGLGLSKESWSVSYIINPNQDTAFLVIGKSF